MSAELSVLVFVLTITVGVFILPLVVRNFTKNQVLNSILSGSCIIMGLYLLSLDTAIVLDLVDAAGLAVKQELFTYLFIINWGAYIAMVFVTLRFLFSTIMLWQQNKKDERMGLT